MCVCGWVLTVGVHLSLCVSEYGWICQCVFMVRFSSVCVSQCVDGSVCMRVC